MDKDRKPRSDSVLKNLPKEKQEDIIDYLREHSITETLAWLKGDNITTSRNPLSEFGRWFTREAQLDRNEASARQVVERYKRENPEAAQAELDVVGQLFFSQLAIDEQNNLDFKRIQDVRLRRLGLGLATRKQQVSEAKYRAEVKARKEEMKRELAAARGQGGISEATLEKIERELNLL